MNETTLDYVRVITEADMLYYVADSAAAYRILEASKSARAYVLALTYIPWPGAPDEDDRDELNEFQGVVRLMHAKAEAFNVLKELGIDL